MKFHEILRQRRLALGLTQEQLALMLGVSRQSVTKWEAEKSYPEMDKLLKLCQKKESVTAALMQFKV